MPIIRRNLEAGKLPVASGPFCRLTDKGTNIIARRRDGSPIQGIKGGCDRYQYCKEADMNVRVVVTYQAVLSDPEEPEDIDKITELKQTFYRLMRDAGLTMIDPIIKHAVAVNDWENWLIG